MLAFSNRFADGQIKLSISSLKFSSSASTKTLKNSLVLR